MFIEGTLKKLNVSALSLFLEKQQFGNKKMKKNEKLVLISACLAKAQLDKATIDQAARKVKDRKFRRSTTLRHTLRYEGLAGSTSIVAAML